MATWPGPEGGFMGIRPGYIVEASLRYLDRHKGTSVTAETTRA